MIHIYWVIGIICFIAIEFFIIKLGRDDDNVDFGTFCALNIGNMCVSAIIVGLIHIIKTDLKFCLWFLAGGVAIGLLVGIKYLIYNLCIVRKR